MAVEVADQPAQPRLAFHVAQEGAQLIVGHMVGDLARDDEVERPCLVEIVAGAIVDREVGGRRRARRRDALLVEVDADQIGRDAALLRPAGDRAQHVAVAEADVHQPEAFRLADRALEVGEHRQSGERPAVDAGEVVEDLLVDRRIEIGGVHLLFLAGADGELAHGAPYRPGAALKQ